MSNITPSTLENQAEPVIQLQGDAFDAATIKHIEPPARPWHLVNRHGPRAGIVHLDAGAAGVRGVYAQPRGQGPYPGTDEHHNPLDP